MSATHLWFQCMPSPVGELKLVANDKALVAVLWEQHRLTRIPLEQIRHSSHHSILNSAKTQLDAYFAGHRQSFELLLEPAGTPFQQEVWGALQATSYGQTLGYGDIAALIGRPKACRAVGSANGRNPIAIIIPCHRVVGATGHLTGFAGGLRAKAFLLSHERLSMQGETEG